MVRLWDPGPDDFLGALALKHPGPRPLSTPALRGTPWLQGRPRPSQEVHGPGHWAPGSPAGASGDNRGTGKTATPEQPPGPREAPRHGSPTGPQPTAPATQLLPRLGSRGQVGREPDRGRAAWEGSCQPSPEEASSGERKGGVWTPHRGHCSRAAPETGCWGLASKELAGWAAALRGLLPLQEVWGFSAPPTQDRQPPPASMEPQEARGSAPKHVWVPHSRSHTRTRGPAAHCVFTSADAWRLCLEAARNPGKASCSRS